MYHLNSHSTFRFSFAIASAAVVAFSLLYIMQSLIRDTHTMTLDETESRIFIGYIRPTPEEQPLPHREEVKPDEPSELPPDPVFDENNTFEPLLSHFGAKNKGLRFSPVTDKIIFQSVNSELIPVVEMQPVYPHSAVSRNIEGYVIVGFTVTASGSTGDIQILEAHPSDIFNKAAIKATGKSRYKPKIVNGKAEAVTGMRKMFTFRLDD